MIAFNRAMKNNEAVLFSGIHRFSRYSGYSKSFKFNGTFEYFII